jgi:hypothetical protein
MALLGRPSAIRLNISSSRSLRGSSSRPAATASGADSSFARPSGTSFAVTVPKAATSLRHARVYLLHRGDQVGQEVRQVVVAGVQ